MRAAQAYSMLALGLVGIVAASVFLGVSGMSLTATQPRTGGFSDPASGRRIPESVNCNSATSAVTTAADLQNALDAATAGTVIHLAATVYTGQFRAHTSGKTGKPITLCGTADSVLDGGGISHGYVFHLDGASDWVLQGFTIRNGQKGLMVDASTGSVVEGLTIHSIGDEGIHLRNNSTDNLITGNHIRDTGRLKPKFGEGIYVGTAQSNWCDITNCQADRSDRNVISKNSVSATTAESVDIKEGTSGGLLSENTFDGSSINSAEAWVNVKGNGWTIEGNVGTNSPKDGFQTHQILDGWGIHNTFRNNTATVNGPGFGYALTPVLSNTVACSNTASGAREGLSNTHCSTG
jgi:parallel beta-helix repeat protein